MEESTERQLIDELRRCGLRATGQRLAILRAIRENRLHPSAEELMDQLKESQPTLSLSTVYKNLQTLAEAGVLQTVDTGTGKQRFEGRPEPHHHAVCTRCQRVYDVDFAKFPVQVPQLDLDPHFKIQAVKVCFSGKCHHCNGNAKVNTGKPY